MSHQQHPHQMVMDAAPAVPEKFRDPDTGALRTEALINSYLALEKKLSTMIKRPETEEDRRDMMRCLGCPETPEEYDIKLENSLLESDPEVNQRLHARGLTADQVQEVYDLASEKLVPMILELAGEFQADREVERLKAAFGGEEQWREMSRQLLAFGKKNLSPEVLDNLSSSFEGVMALHRMMKGGEPAMASLSGGEDGGGYDLTEQELQTMMRDPRYWRDRDPAYITRVTKGFSRLYSDGTGM